jgi:hypothetical protein
MGSLSAGRPHYAGQPRVSDLDHVPFRVLDDSAIFRPREPTGAWFSLVRFVEDANHTRGVATVSHFGDTPHSEITI